MRRLSVQRRRVGGIGRRSVSYRRGDGKDGLGFAEG